MVLMGIHDHHPCADQYEHLNLFIFHLNPLPSSNYTTAISQVALIWCISWLNSEVYFLGARSHVSFDMTEYGDHVDGLDNLRLLNANHTAVSKNMSGSTNPPTSELYSKVVETHQSKTTSFYARSLYRVARL